MLGIRIICTLFIHMYMVICTIAAQQGKRKLFCIVIQPYTHKHIYYIHSIYIYINKLYTLNFSKC